MAGSTISARSAIDKRGMLVEVDSVRRVFTEESGVGVEARLAYDGLSLTL